jgi:hypothetical protein
MINIDAKYDNERLDPSSAGFRQEASPDPMLFCMLFCAGTSGVGFS